MATLARLSRKALTSSPLTSHHHHLLRRTLAAEAAAATPKITESPDRVKWDYRGQRKIIPLGQWLPKIAVDAYVAPNVVLAGQVTVYDGASVWNGSVLRGDLNKITVGFCSNVQERCVVHAAWSSPTGFRRPLTLCFKLRTSRTLKSMCTFCKFNGVTRVLLDTVVISLFCSQILALGVVTFSNPGRVKGPSHKVARFRKSVKVVMVKGLPAETSIERFVSIGASSLLRSCTIEPECIIGQHSILMEGSLVETHSILEAGTVVPPGRRIPTGELWAGNPARFVRTLTHEETLEIPKLAVAINDLSKSYFMEFLPYSTVYLEVEKLKKKLGISI
ncbi:hypothetical protein RHGRI_035056 [Rhododendron griersonianum]|uniref:Gamma carbonic anhydrase-like 2, mitochondrial n=1 Tax=Rhododendron griersonianum TaxID=479676 RepID=A0AAV6I5W1_9ERIC|nr:hypothetical protein RHGRI_035056 [Rhododendron griersonianum]KAG5523115.1 hypothetical protein RHGRI_035056 [Rhododendron griersonianum]